MSNIPSFYNEFGLTKSTPVVLRGLVDPTATKVQADVGTIYVNTVSNAAFIQTGSGVMNWINIEGGQGVFNGIVNNGAFAQTGASTLVGTANINATGAAATNIGNAASAVTIAGTTLINDAVNDNTGINTTGSTGTVTIGNTAAGGVVGINSLTTVTTLATTSANINTSGAGATNVGSTGTGGNIAISAASGSSILLRTAGTTASTGAGNISMIPQIVTAAGTAATLNGHFGQVILTGNTVAGNATSGALTITNGAVSGGSPILVTAYTPTVNAALSCAVQIPAGGGSFNVYVTNATATTTGAANIYINFWVLG